MKKCTACGRELDLSMFYSIKTKGGRKKAACKKCNSERVKSYRRTEHGRIVEIYNKQRSRSKKKGWDGPIYSFDEFKEWVLSNDNWDSIYNNWVKSGYDVNKTPSVDRIDDYDIYKFGNIRLVTWEQNNIKAHKDRKNGNNNKVNKAVLMYSKDGEYIREFHSLAAASRFVGVYRSKISESIKRGGTSAGYVWEFRE
jgi:hypothetical protein